MKRFWIALFLPVLGVAQAPPDEPGITVDAGAALQHRTPVRYPKGVTNGGLVILEANLDKQGEVTDVRVVSGPEELRKEALSSVLTWHYAGEAAAPASVRIAMKFDPHQAANEPVLRSGARGIPATSSIVSAVQIDGLSTEFEHQVRAKLSVKVGDAFTPDVADHVRTEVGAVDEHLSVTANTRTKQDGTGETTIRIGLAPDSRLASLIAGLAAGVPPPPPPPPSPGGPARLRVGGNVQAANLVSKVAPTYPPLAKQARLQGTVSFSAIIGTDGRIIDLQLISGHPLLAQSALEAVRQWVYRPMLLNGQPVEVITQIDVNYTLSQ